MDNIGRETLAEKDTATASGAAQPALEWGMAMQPAVCEHCDWKYLLAAGGAPPRCPHCMQAVLTLLDYSPAVLTYASPPELVLPYTVTSSALSQEIQSFASNIPFAPADLSPEHLSKRLTRLYLPKWLVDAEAQAIWKAEAGFNYEVVSHQDRYEENRGGWSSRQVKETRIRWEPRLGRLSRKYHNIAAPALETSYSAAALASSTASKPAGPARSVPQPGVNEIRHTELGGFDLEAARPFEPQALRGAYVRLPDRSQADAWTDARPVLQGVAAEEVRQAAGADHIRQFSWQPEFSGQNWSLLLMPIYATYYFDDDQQPQSVLIHGQSGKLSGKRRASPRRARRTALWMLGASVLTFIASIALLVASVLLPLLAVIGIAGMAFTLLLAAGAILPLIIAWWFNRQQTTG